MLAPIIAGTVFAGDYRIVRPLADGGMGTVYVAEQLSTGKRRALKLLKPELSQDPKTFGRFEQEARVASRIQSEHVVEVVAAGLDPATGIPWLAMELLEGVDLGALLAQRGPLPPSDVRELLSQLCHALAAAHRAGVVHRDLKPENVFVANAHQQNARFKVVVLDFGIAKVLEAARANSPATAALGTPRWMSPEQTDGRVEITPAADIWALGLLAFQLLTGRSYWTQGNAGEGANVMALMREILFDDLPPPSERARSYGVAHLLPRGFDAWFLRCLEREPSARFQEAGAAMAALDPLLAQPSLPPASAGALVPAPYAPWPMPTPSHPAVVVTRKRALESTWLAGRGKWAIGLVIAGLVGALGVTSFLLLRATTAAGGAKAAPNLSGSYAITASKNPKGGGYAGSVLMTRTGATYRVAWTIAGGPGYEGVALLSDRTLGVGWGNPNRYGLVVYAIEGRRLQGRWTEKEGTAVGTEELEGPATLSGTFTIRRSSNGSMGKVTITPKGELYELGWVTNRGRFRGVGLRSRDQLVVGYAPLGGIVGVVVYDVSPSRGPGGDPWGPGTLVGRWTALGEEGVGRETLTRR